MMITILVLLLAISAGDTLRLDLEEAVDRALHNNLDHRIRSLTHTGSKLAFADRASSYLPQPSLQASYLDYESVYAGGIPLVGRGYDVEMSITQPILDLQKLASIWGGKADLEASSAALEEARSSLSYEVENLYLNVLREMKALEIGESALKRAEENKRLIEARKSLGQASRLDVLNASVTLNQSKLALINTEKDLKIAKRLFLDILGIRDRREVLLESPPDSETGDELPSLDSLLAVAYSRRPVLHSLSKSITSAQTDFVGQLLSFVPSLSYQWSWQYQGEEFPGPGKFRDEALEGAGLSAHVTFNPISYTLGVQKSKTALDVAKAEFEAERILVAKQVEEAYFTYASARDNFRLADLTLEAAQEGEQLARAQYSLGLIKPLELFDSETRLRNAEADLLSAQYDLHLARSGLRLAVGGGYSL